MKALPADLSGLKNLHTLNINDNPFEDFAAVVAALQTLSSLRCLSLNLQRNEEVELVLSSLPNLEVLNDQGSLRSHPLEVDHEDDTEEERENASLRNSEEGKSECQYPEKDQGEDKAQECAESGSPGEENCEDATQQEENECCYEKQECGSEGKGNAHTVISKVEYEEESGIPETSQKQSHYEYQEDEKCEDKVEEYQYEDQEDNAEMEQESELQSQEHPDTSKLEHSQHEEHSQYSTVKEEEANLEDLEEAVRIYDDFRAISKMAKPSHDKALEEEFEQRMSRMANELKKDLETNASPELKSARILKVRSDIIDITFQKLIAAIPDKPIANLWSNIRKEHNIIVKGFVKLVEASQSTNRSSGEDVIQARQEMLEVKKNLEEEVKRQLKEKEKLKRQFATERKELVDQISSLEKENQKYLNNIIKRSKMAASSHSTVNNSSIQPENSKDLKKPMVSSCAHQ
eukprot:TRINITY_DN2593_c0_g2_i1.p2 TRINITY_DN2593_c0_g2~~TRINITY_DN2593_c0_g2_i1.p2  ORF type:complete len:461 (-),score=134.64 TRINITY_DN2593_c0_g2_i1:3812-5194(-)